MSIEFINMFLKPNNIQKKKNGEVFTPLELIREKCSKVPEEFWRDKNVKVLDPCCGIGNYQVVLIEFFMKGLVEEIKDERERLEWIKTRIIYCSDICALNVALCKKITGVENVYCMDFLEKNTFDEMKFDMVIGNPPYQKPNSTGDNKLYLYFTKKSLNILTTNGLLLYITPRNILEYLLLVEKNRKYINIFYQIKYLSIETSKKYFSDIGSTFVYFLLEKIKYYEKTTIEYINCYNKSETINIILSEGYKIPRMFTETDREILSRLLSTTDNYILHDFIFENKVQRIRKHHLSKNIISDKETDNNKIKIIDTVNKTNPFPGKYYYYNLKDIDFDKEKLILSKKGYLMPYIDKSKSYTYSDNFKYIIDDNMEQIKLLLSSNITKYLLFQYSKNGFDSVNIIKTIFKKNLTNVKTEDDLYKIYNLTEDHVSYIKNILKSK